MKSTLPALLILSVFAAPALAEGDADAGEKVFRKCKACHQVGADAQSRTGPVLNGIVGAPAGAVEDFSYSSAREDAAADGLVWTEENLAAFLAKPREFMKGTRMSFAGLRRDTEIADVIAYLATQE